MHGTISENEYIFKNLLQKICSASFNIAAIYRDIGNTSVS